jgi:disulfide oxidoreductase YuzD
LQRQHGESVRLDYVDLADSAARAEYQEVLATIEERDLPYPLVAINGQLRLAGTAHYYQVAPLVDELLEAVNVS